MNYEKPVVVDLSHIARTEGQIIEYCGTGNAAATGCQSGADIGLGLLCDVCTSGVYAG